MSLFKMAWLRRMRPVQSPDPSNPPSRRLPLGLTICLLISCTSILVLTAVFFYSARGVVHEPRQKNQVVAATLLFSLLGLGGVALALRALLFPGRDSAKPLDPPI